MLCRILTKSFSQEAQMEIPLEHRHFQEMFTFCVPKKQKTCRNENVPDPQVEFMILLVYKTSLIFYTLLISWPKTDWGIYWVIFKWSHLLEKFFFFKSAPVFLLNQSSYLNHPPLTSSHAVSYDSTAVHRNFLCKWQ